MRRTGADDDEFILKFVVKSERVSARVVERFGPLIHCYLSQQPKLYFVSSHCLKVCTAENEKKKEGRENCCNTTYVKVF